VRHGTDALAAEAGERRPDAAETACGMQVAWWNRGGWPSGVTMAPWMPRRRTGSPVGPVSTCSASARTSTPRCRVDSRGSTAGRIA
jgi:hypothetical protein